MTTPTPERAAELPELERMTPGIYKGTLTMFPSPDGNYYRKTDVDAALAAARPSEAISVAAKALVDRLWKTDLKGVPFHLVADLRSALENAAAPRPEVPPPDVVDPAQALRPDARELLPHAYMLAKLAMVMPLFQEARDALPALNTMQLKLHGISSTLADRMDIAGTYSLDDWEATSAASGNQPEAPEPDVQAQSGVRPEVPQEAVAKWPTEQITEYIEDYEFCCDEGYYSPSERERDLIADAIHGLLAENEILAAICACRATPPEPKVAAPQEVVALWQYRWTNPANDANAPAVMLKWKEVEPWMQTQTLEQRIEELRAFRYDGKPAYEVRALYATSPEPRVEVPQEAPDKPGWRGSIYDPRDDPQREPQHAQTRDRELLAWAYSKLAYRSFDSMDDALAMDEIKLILMGAQG